MHKKVYGPRDTRDELHEMKMINKFQHWSAILSNFSKHVRIIFFPYFSLTLWSCSLARDRLDKASSSSRILIISGSPGSGIPGRPEDLGLPSLSPRILDYAATAARAAKKERTVWGCLNRGSETRASNWFQRAKGVAEMTLLCHPYTREAAPAV